MSELKNCPCCNSEATLFKIETPLGNPEYFIRCSNSECPIETKQWLGRDNVVKPWNNRHESVWIKCSEQLPDDDGLFLVSNGKYVTIGCFINDGDGYYFQDETQNEDYEDITHWRELPPPPMEDGE